MRKRFWFAGLALLALLVGVLTLRARSADFSVNGVTDFLSDVQTSMAARDANHDGQLDSNELKSFSWMLLVMDANKDHRLSPDELRAGEGKLSQNLFPSRAAAPAMTMAPPFEPKASAQQGPRRLKPADWKVGTLVPDVELRSAQGEARRLRSLAGPQGTVIVVRSESCPISQRYRPALGRLEKTYAARGWAFVSLAAPGEEEAVSDAWLDPAGILLRTLEATRTTDVFVLDAAQTLIYRGAIDDQYGLGYRRAEPTQRYLANALDEAETGRPITIAATQAPGCELELPAPPVAATAPAITWHNRISRIVQANCLSCHRSGGVAPFAFESSAQFLRKAGTVRRVVQDGIMPPWFAAEAAAGTHTPWWNERALSATDKSDLLRWLAGDRPEGDPAEAPLPCRWPVGWQIGQPDLIVQIPQPIQVAAEGTMPYQSIMVETGLQETKWVSGWEIRPTALSVVHHVLVYVYDPKAKGLPGSAERHGQLAGYAPGTIPSNYPPGFAKELPAGSRLRFEIHYTPNGHPVTDQTQIGLKFAAGPPQYVVESAGVANVRLKIPPGAADHPEAAEWTAPTNVHLLALTPHMHARGKAMRFEVTQPGDVTRTLVDMPRYDFNWQLSAAYAEPPELPAGSVVKVTGWFDNSAANSANPDAAATVRWGSQTTDEMMIGYVDYYRERK